MAQGGSGFDGKLSGPGAPPETPLYPQEPMPLQPAPIGAPPPPGMYGLPPRQHAMATTAFACGLGSLPTVCCCSILSVPLSVTAIVCGIIGLERVSKQPDVWS